MTRDFFRSCRWLRLFLIAAAAFCWWGAFSKVRFVGIDSDMTIFLDPARSFADGRGLATYMLEPAQLAFYPPGVKPPVLYLHHGPVAPWLLGLGLRLLHMADWTHLLIGFFLTFLTGLLVYVLADDLAGERTALTATALFWSSVLIMEGVIGAPADPPFIFFLTLAVLCLWRSSSCARPRLWVGACGLALGLASCTRLAGQTYWFGFALSAWWLHRRDWRLAACLLAGVALCLIPLALYNYAAAGVFFYSPGYYMLNWSHTFPGFRARTTFMDISSVEAVLRYPRDFALKAVTGPLYALKSFTQAPSGAALMFCAALGLLTDFGASGRSFSARDSAAGSAGADRFRTAAAIIALPPFVFNAVISYGGLHYLSPLVPLFAVLAALFLGRFVTSNLGVLARRPLLGAAAFLFVFLGPAVIDLKDALKERPTRLAAHAAFEQLGSFVRRETRPGEVVYTDANHLVAWQAQRPSIPLAATLDDAQKCFQHTPPDAILVTSLRSDSEDFDPMWRRALAQRTGVMGFVPCRQYSVPSALAVLFRRPAECPAPLRSTPQALPPALGD